MNENLSDLQPLVLFDGPCTLCRKSVRFLLRHEQAPELQFASLQSDLAKQALQQYQVPQDSDAIVLLVDDRAWIGSEAALRLASYLKAPYRWGRIFRFLPAAFHQAVYRWIARHRYRWFGRDEQCPLPDPEQAERFLTD